MRDYLTLGPTPAGEDCAQVGDPTYYEKARPECVRYVELLRKKFGPEPIGARFRIKEFPHDFGSYMEVVIEFEGKEAANYAFKIEGDLPERWE